MKKTNKSTFLLALAVGSVFAATAGVVSISNVNRAVAEEVTVETVDGNFEVRAGASVRLHNTRTGIRFACDITEEYYNAVIAANPNANVKLATEISVNKAGATPEVLWCTTTPDFTDDGVFTYYAAMTFDNLTAEELAKAVELEMTATAQIYDYTDAENYTLIKESESGDTRSMKAVANMAKLKGEDKGLLDSYVGNATVNENVDMVESVNAETELTLNVGAGTYEDAYIGAEKTTLTVAEDGSATVAGEAFASTKAGDVTYVSVFNDGEIYATPVQYVTQALSDETELETLLTNGATIDGYYVLDNDITVESWATNHLSMTFNGVFDGQGHTITMTDKVNGGLLGDFCGTVKNLGIIFNVTKNNIYSYESGQAAILARTPKNAVVENLYVKVNTAENISLNQSFSVFGSMWSGNYYKSFKNVVLDYTDSNMALENSTYNAIGGYMFHEDHYANAKNLSYEGVYVISPYAYKYMHFDKNKKNLSRAENDADVVAPEGYNMSMLTGVKRYDTWAALKSVNGSLDSFANEYWNIENGAPVWHAITAIDDLFAVEWTGDNLIWSTNEVQLAIPEEMGALTDVAEIYNKTDSVTVYDGEAWTADTLNNTTNELVSKDIRIKFKNGTTYLATLDCVTQAISDATELESVLPASGTVTGYYILDNDIPVSAWTIANHNGFNFNGVLDGQGYTISAPQILYGLFGNFGGTIKNVDIQITKVLTSGVYTYTGPNAGIISNHIVGTANVENVNVKLCGTTNEIKVTFSTFGYLNYATTKLNLKNVVIDCGDVVSETLTGTTYSGLLVHWGNCASKVAATNVYFISSTHKYLSADNSTNNTNCYVAANDTTLQHPTLTTNTLAGVYRYDSWDGVATDVLNALDSDYWTVENGALVWAN